MNINGLSSQNTALSILKTAAGASKALNPQSAKQQAQADTLMAALEKSDPERAAALKQENERLKQTISQLQSSRTDQSTERKEAARQKIEQIKAKIQALRMMAAANPKAAARQAAQLGRELAAAAKEYAGAGGSASEAASTSMTGTVTAGQQPAAGTGTQPADTQGNPAAATPAAEAAQVQSAPEVASITVPSASAQAATTDGETEHAATQETQPGAADDDDTATGFDAAKEKLAQDIAQARKRLGENEADTAFARETRRLMNELKNIVRSAAEKLNGTDGDNDIAAAQKAFREIEKSLNEITTGALAGTVASIIDITV